MSSGPIAAFSKNRETSQARVTGIMTESRIGPNTVAGITLPVLLAASLCHLLNDLMQSVFTATYPMIKSDFGLTFAQVGFLTLTYQLSASILQPLIGLYTDRRPMPYSLPFASAFSMAGIFALSIAPSYEMLLLVGLFLASAHRFSIQRHRGWRALRQVSRTDLRSRSFRLAAILARLLVRSLSCSSSCRGD